MSTTRMRLYSTDIAPTTTPSWAATIVVWDHDATDGVEVRMPERRATMIPTMGGAVWQDYGPTPAGGEITIRGSVTDGTWLRASTVAALRAAEAQVGAEWYWTDGWSVWRVRIRSFDAWRDLMRAEQGIDAWSYELVLWIVGVAI